MRFTKLFVPTVLLCCLITVPVAAQGLGYYPVEEIGLLEPGNLEVDVNLEGSALQIAVGAMQDQDPRLKDLVSNLTRVRVQVGAAKGVAESNLAPLREVDERDPARLAGDDTARDLFTF